MLQYPGFDKIALEIGPFFGFGPLQVHWYGVMYLIGFAGAWWLARRRAAQPQSTWTALDVDDFLFFAMIGVILGGRIGYVLFYGMQFWHDDPWYPFKITQGGMSFHGGLAGVLIAISIFAWRRGGVSLTCSISPRRFRGSDCLPDASAISSTASFGPAHRRPMGFHGRRRGSPCHAAV